MRTVDQEVLNSLSNDTIEPIVNAWIQPGPRPDIHLNAIKDLRKNWPTLANAVENLVKVYCE